MANQLFKRMTLCRIQLDNYIFDLYYQLTPASLALETKSDLETASEVAGRGPIERKGFVSAVLATNFIASLAYLFGVALL